MCAVEPECEQRRGTSRAAGVEHRRRLQHDGDSRGRTPARPSARGAARKEQPPERQHEQAGADREAAFRSCAPRSGSSSPTASPSTDRDRPRGRRSRRCVRRSAFRQPGLSSRLCAYVDVLSGVEARRCGGYVTAFHTRDEAEEVQQRAADEPGRAAASGGGPSSPAAGLALVRAAEEREWRTEQDQQVGERRAVLDVPDVQLDPLVPGERRAAVDLRPARDPGRTSSRFRWRSEYFST